MCNDPMCCASEADACYLRVGRGFHLCRPLDHDGTCHDSPAWACPVDEGADGVNNVSSMIPATASSRVSTPGNGDAQLALDATTPKAEASAEASRAEQSTIVDRLSSTLHSILSKVSSGKSISPIVMVLAATAGIVVLLFLLLILLRCAKQRQRQAASRGGRKAKHTRLSGKEDETRADESGSDEEAPTAIETAVLDEKELIARVEQETDVIDEKELLARVESLLSDAPPALANHHRME